MYISRLWYSQQPNYKPSRKTATLGCSIAAYFIVLYKCDISRRLCGVVVVVRPQCAGLYMRDVMDIVYIYSLKPCTSRRRARTRPFVFCSKVAFLWLYFEFDACSKKATDRSWWRTIHYTRHVDTQYKRTTGAPSLGVRVQQRPFLECGKSQRDTTVWNRGICEIFKVQLLADIFKLPLLKISGFIYSEFSYT